MSIWTKIFRKNDWIPVWTTTGNWIYIYPEFNNQKETKHAYYEILFSKSRNKYKLEVGGVRPKEHSVYSEVINKLNEFINKQNK